MQFSDFIRVQLGLVLAGTTEQWPSTLQFHANIQVYL